MGQSIVVTEKPSSNRGVVRFETNRALTGMGHERYVKGQDVWGERPPDELARRLLARDAVAGVQINGNMVTVDLTKGYDSVGLSEIIENLYRFYPDVVEAADTTPEAVAADALAPETDEEPAPEPAAADAPAEDAPAADAPAEAAAAEEAPAEDAPAEEPAAADAPADDAPAAQDAPAEDTPAEDTPAEAPAAEA